MRSRWDKGAASAGTARDESHQSCRTRRRAAAARAGVGPGERLAAAAGRTLRIWDRAGTLILDLQSPATIYDIAWRPGGRAIAAAGYGGVRIWRLEMPETARRARQEGPAGELAVTPCPQLLTGTSPTPHRPASAMPGRG
jgi:hypothetical protein